MTAETIKKAIAKILELEGGYSNHPADRGGATAYGISSRWIEQYGRAYGLRSAEDVTPEIAVLIYHHEFVERYRWRDLPDWLGAFCTVHGVNIGGRVMNRLLQMALTEVLRYALGEKGIAADGIIGKKTMAAIDTVEEAGQSFCLLNTLVWQCTDRYRRIARRQEQRVFLYGWLNRLHHERQWIIDEFFSDGAPG